MTSKTYFPKRIFKNRNKKFILIFEFLKIVFLRHFFLFISCVFLAIANVLLNFNIGVNFKDAFFDDHLREKMQYFLSKDIVKKINIKNNFAWVIDPSNIDNVDSKNNFIKNFGDDFSKWDNNNDKEKINLIFLNEKDRDIFNGNYLIEIRRDIKNDNFLDLDAFKNSNFKNKRVYELLEQCSLNSNFTIFDKKYEFFFRFFNFKLFHFNNLSIERFVLSTLILILSKSIFSLSHFYLMHYSYDLIEKEMKECLFSHFINSRYYKSSQISRDILTQFSNDLDIISYGIWFVPNRIIYAVFSIFYHLLYDFNFGIRNKSNSGYSNSSFIFIVFLLFFGLIIVELVMFNFANKISIYAKKRIAEDNSTIYSSINRLQYIKSVSGEKYEEDVISKKLNSTFEKNKLALVLMVLYKAVPNYLISPSIPILFVSSVLVFINNSLRSTPIFLFSNFVRYYFTVQKLNSEMEKLIDGLLNLNDLYGSLGIISDSIISLDEEEKNNDKPITSSFPDGDIVFENVCFSYPKRNSILNNFNFSFKKGKTYGIVGNNGAGKSTIVKLILKLYDVDNGIIKIGNAGINSIDKKLLHENICYQTNKPGEGFFEGSIIENVLYPNSNFSDDKLMNEMLVYSSKKVGIYDFINNLPNGFNTILNDKGSDLSEGQKQQISAMKIFINDYKIYIFDEPLSNVSPELRKSILHEIFEKIKGKTTLVIDHRVNETFDREEFEDIYRFSDGVLYKKSRKEFVD